MLAEVAAAHLAAGHTLHGFVCRENGVIVIELNAPIFPTVRTIAHTFFHELAHAVFDWRVIGELNSPRMPQIGDYKADQIPLERRANEVADYWLARWPRWQLERIVLKSLGQATKV